MTFSDPVEPPPSSLKWGRNVREYEFKDQAENNRRANRHRDYSTQGSRA